MKDTTDNLLEPTRRAALMRYPRSTVVSFTRQGIPYIEGFVALCLLLCGGGLISGCSRLFYHDAQAAPFSSADTAQINKVIIDYRLGWLAGDRQKVLNLFADDATLVPSGLRPIHGKVEMSKFWWPQDGSTTTINSYEIEVLKIDGSGRQAYALENGHLSWSYAKRETGFSKNQEFYEVTLFRKDAQGRWRITERIWTDVKG